MNWLIFFGILIGISPHWFAINFLRESLKTFADEWYEYTGYPAGISVVLSTVSYYFYSIYAGEFFLTIFIVNIVIAVVTISYISIKLFYIWKKKIDTKKAEMRKKYEDDVRYNLIINCPKCLGNGEVIREDWSFNDIKIDDYVHERSIYPRPDSWELNGKIKEINNWRYRYDKIKCPFCKGTGVAYAYFENTTEKCSECNGNGKIIKKVLVKMNIGAKEQEIENKCTKCNGLGIFDVEYCHVKTLAEQFEIISFIDKNTYDKFDVILNNENREFYLNSKPRF